jgi:acetylornithine deacetylase/succinyl-diaminopimelate desuccinylase-like protein
MLPAVGSAATATAGGDQRVSVLQADVEQALEARAEEHINALTDLIRQPSRTGELDEVRACADIVVKLATAAGWEARAVDVDELAPVVLATFPGPPGAPRLLLYSHYDVITPEPVAEWTYPPFAATRVGDKIIGRGSSDAKANVLSLIYAAEAYRDAAGGPPVSLTLILDGEEERGSTNLPAFVEQYRDALASDAVLSFDGAIDASGVPKIGLGTSGMVYVELGVQTATGELHSARARLFPNAAWRLVWALASIKGADERVLIEGFDDPIRPPSDEDRRLMSQMPWDDARQLSEAGVDRFLGGVRGVDAIERLLYTPGLAICGISSGFEGEGPKAIIPPRATAKLEFRIVPDQTPADVFAALRRHLDAKGFEDVELRLLADVETARTDPDAPIVAATVRAATALYGPPMIKPTEEYAGRQGAWVGSRLGVAGVQTGVGPPGHRGHASDEFVTVSHYLKGIRYAALIYREFADG